MVNAFGRKECWKRAINGYTIRIILKRRTNLIAILKKERRKTESFIRKEVRVVKFIFTWFYEWSFIVIFVGVYT